MGGGVGTNLRPLLSTDFWWAVSLCWVRLRRHFLWVCSLVLVRSCFLFLFLDFLDGRLLCLRGGLRIWLTDLGV